MKQIEPYDFQTSSAHSAYNLAVKKKRPTLIVSPGGSGKTVIIALIAARAIRSGLSVLIVARGREIIKQVYAHLQQCGLNTELLSVIMAGLADTYEEAASVQVASLDTLRVRTSNRRIRRPEADVLIVDEAQHIVARTYRNLVKKYPDAALIGLTATPWRLDGKGLSAVFAEMIVAIQHSDLVHRGLLALPRMFVAPDEYLPVLQGIQIQRGDYAHDELERAVNKSKLVGNVIDNWAEHAPRDWRTLVSAVSIEHSHHLAGRFDGAGVSASHLDGSMPLAERERILKDFARGRITVLCYCMVLAEGYNLPACKVAVSARPTKSLALFYQQSARVFRAYGNLRPILLDHAQNIIEHGPPHLDREFSLEGLKKRRKSDGPQAKICPNPECLAASAMSATECPECGTDFPEPEHRSMIEETDEQLIELTKEIREQQRARLQAFVETKPRSYFGKITPTEWIEEVLSKWCGPEYGN